VTGTIVPNSVGDYDTLGTYNDKSYARHKTLSFYIWWNGTNAWIISAVLGTTGSNYHKRTDPNINGVYAPQGTATGNATVAEGYTP